MKVKELKRYILLLKNITTNIVPHNLLILIKYFISHIFLLFCLNCKTFMKFVSTIIFRMQFKLNTTSKLFCLNHQSPSSYPNKAQFKLNTTSKLFCLSHQSPSSYPNKAKSSTKTFICTSQIQRYRRSYYPFLLFFLAFFSWEWLKIQRWHEYGLLISWITHFSYIILKKHHQLSWFFYRSNF